MKNPPQAIEHLRRSMRSLERCERLTTVISTGCEALDQLLPGGGLRLGTLTEWLAGHEGSGVATLAMIVAREACRDDGVLVLLDRNRRFYPPAAWALGINPSNLIVIQPRSNAEEVWAIDQALRCPAVAVVVGSLEKLDVRSFRRLQLAAEAGKTVGLLLRPDTVRGQPSWADVQLLIEPRRCRDARRLRVRVVRCRGATTGGKVQLEVDAVRGGIRQVSSNDETHHVHLVSELAHSADRRRSAGA